MWRNLSANNPPGIPQSAVFPLTQNSLADEATSLAISGIQTGWGPRYVHPCFRASLSKLRRV